MTKTSAAYEIGVMACESERAAGPRISCRQMREADIDAAVALLVEGFPERSGSYWRGGLQRLRDRRAPEGFPRFGYVLVERERLVGIAILIFAMTDGRAYANVSSWYVKATYRAFSSALLAPAFRLKNTVLFNVSPTPSTLETIEAQGFSRYCAGTFHALPLMQPMVRGATVRLVEPDHGPDASRLARLAAYGCHSFEVFHEGRVHPFAFLSRRFARDRLPGAQLVYCESTADFVRYAGALGRRLARHRIFSVMLGANGSIPGLSGRYADGKRVQYHRGDTPPPLNDLSATELVIFGP